MARRRFRGRAVSGIVVIDKPSGLTSNDVLQKVKRLYGAAKAGHTGSLDPLATGVLPVCFGGATRLSQYLLDSDKHYLAVAKLGVRTETGDSDGAVLERRPVAVERADIDAALERFRGAVEQLPSMYSAIKYKGRPLYSYAREGIEVERSTRVVSIHTLLVRAFEGDELTIEVACSKGTYIRTLVEDLGEVLGCGAHVAALRRLKAGPYDQEQSYTLESLEAVRAESGEGGLDRLLFDQSTAVSHWPAVILGQASSYYITQGQPVQVRRAPTSGYVRIYRQMEDDHHMFLGVGEIQDDGLVAPRKLIAQSA